MTRTHKQHGLQVIKVSQQPGRRYELNQEALESVLLRPDVSGLPVVVVSVAGVFRGGKSFILDFFLRYLKASPESQESTNWLGGEDEVLEGFDWRGGGESNTKGIHLWPEPIIVTIKRTGKKVAVILMDTQGTFDMDSDMGDNSTIFALSTLLSSVQIYNLRANIGEDDLQHLQLFTEYGKLVCNADRKAFQSLLFLIRDWSNPYEHPYGYRGGEGLMNKRFEPRRNQNSQVQEVRDHIHSCFESLQCFLMPHPGLAVTDEKFSGRLRDIDARFKQALLELVPSLFDPNNLMLKTINGDKVQAQGLVEFFKQYVEIFNSSEMPKSTTIFQATLDASMMSILREARDCYKTMMEMNIMEDQSVSKDTIRDWHNAAVAAAVEIFEKKKKLGSQSTITARLEDLRRELGSRLDQYLIQNDNKLSKTLSDTKKAFENVVSTVCQDKTRLCLHAEDLLELYREALKTALAVFDCNRTFVSQELDTERNCLLEDFEKIYEQLVLVNEQNNKSALMGAREMYQSCMNDAALPQGVSPEELEEQHNEALHVANVHFSSCRNRPYPDVEDPHLGQLLESLASRYRKLRSVNEEKRRAATETREMYTSRMDDLSEQITRLEKRECTHHHTTSGPECRLL